MKAGRGALGSSAASEPPAQQIAWGPPSRGASGSSSKRAVEDHEWHFAVGLVRGENVPSGGGGGDRQLAGEGRVAGDDDESVATGHRPGLGILADGVGPTV